MPTTLPPTSVPSLDDAPVVVWSCPLDLPEPAWRELTASLPAAECREAEQRRDARDRRRFLAARGWRRRLLGGQLGCEAREVPIVVDERGKPGLAGSELASLRFSAARSAGLALVACSRRMDVGVDVEALDPATDVERFAARFLSGAERRALAAHRAVERRPALFQCWARKEAYLKGTGDGLSVSLATVEVWAGDQRPVTVDGWSVHSLAVDAGFAAAVAGSEPAAWVPSGPHEQAISTATGGDGPGL